MRNLEMQKLVLVFLLFTSFARSQREQGACDIILSELRYPCKCAAEEGTEIYDLQLDLNCDHVVFGDFPVLPYGAPIRSFTQRFAGYQSLPMQAFASRAIPLAVLDFSENSLRHLTEHSLDGLRESLRELVLANNLLGDTLNPIFASGELYGLTELRVLDLRGNKLRALEEGLVKGCPQLQELLLDRNALSAVPSASLNGPRALRALTLSQNLIGTVRRDAFWSQPRLELLDLSSNGVAVLEGGALSGLSRLRALRLAKNRLTRLNSDTFKGAENMEVLDLAENFLGEFPTVALKPLTRLRALNLSSNLVQTLNNADVSTHTNLEVLDLSRNALASLAPGTFVGLRKLRRLFLNVNSLRTVEDDAFEGLENLEFLSLEDNTVLLVPTSALGRLPRLSALFLGFNRVAAVNEALLRPAANVQILSLQYNVIRELPTNAFSNFSRLVKLDLGGNQLQSVSTSTFSGIENVLEELLMQDNRIATLGQLALPALRRLSLARNKLVEIEHGALRQLNSLEELDLSGNSRLESLSQAPFIGLGKLSSLDLSSTGLTQISPGLFVALGGLKRINLSSCKLTELIERSFSVLPQLDAVDLSDNKITTIHPGAFDNVPALRTLLLSGNSLSNFKGDAFNNPGNKFSVLEVLDLADNEINVLYPTSFTTHPRLMKLKIAGNQITSFPAELLAGLNRLEQLDLSQNQITYIDELDFASLPRLRELDFSRNLIEQISEAAFRNSSQIQHINLSHNRLSRLEERSFEGFNRLNLNLSDNKLTELPEMIFDRSKIHVLENINLANNLFEVAPLNALTRQFGSLISVSLSRNKIQDLHPNDKLLINIKDFDISFNPLSSDSLILLFNEPKTVRNLNLAGTGLRQLSTTLETPFLRTLNISHNELTSVTATAFHRATLLESIDLANNSLTSLALPSMPNLQNLDASSNPVEMLSPSDLGGAAKLRRLKLCDMSKLTRLEAAAFQPLTNLEELEAHGFPRLGYLDIKGMLALLPPLQRLDVEVKDASLSDQFSIARHPRMRDLGLRGPRVQQVASSGLLAGMTAPSLTVRLRDTALRTLPPSLLLPVPRSTYLTLDVANSDLSTLSAPLIAALDSRKNHFKLQGLESNPISCDCNAVQLKKWLIGHPSNVTCAKPDDLRGQSLLDLPDSELICGKRITRPPTTEMTTTTLSSTVTTSAPELDIIWSVAPTVAKQPEKTTKRPVNKASSGGNAVTNDDTLIIAIVGGVVAFIALLIVIICIARCRMSSASRYRGGPLAAPPMLPLPACTCVKPPPSSYMSKMPQQSMAYPPMGGQTYYISYPPEDPELHMEVQSMRGSHQ